MRVSIDSVKPSKLRVDDTIPSLSEWFQQFVEDHGQLTPVFVRPVGDRQYEVLDNIETWLALKRSGVRSIDVVVHDGLSDEEAALWVRNGIQRDDPITEAEHLQQLLDQQPIKTGAHQRVGELVGKSRSYVSHSLRYLTLDSEVQFALKTRLLSAGHAKAILMKTDHQDQRSFAEHIINNQLSVHEARKLAKRQQSQRSVDLNDAPLSLESIEEQVSAVLGSKLTINEAEGTLTVDYQKNLMTLREVLIRLGYASD